MDDKTRIELETSAASRCVRVPTGAGRESSRLRPGRSARARLRAGLTVLLLALLVTGCQTPPPAPSAAATAVSSGAALQAKSLATPSLTSTPRPSPSATTNASPLSSPTPSATATPASTPTSRPTPTVEPTLTPAPTVTVPRASTGAPQVIIEQPVAGMFLPVPVVVRGRVMNGAGGEIQLRVQAPDGQAIDLPPVLVPTTAVTNGLTFSGEIPLAYAPTPRGLLITAEYVVDGRVRAYAQQPANAIGRFARLQYTVVEVPRPFSRDTQPAIEVRGAAPGPPKSVLVRLLDAQDQVLESAVARLGWYQPGMPCDFTASVPNVPAGATLQVVSLGDNDKVLEQARVQLGKYAP